MKTVDFGTPPVNFIKQRNCPATPLRPKLRGSPLEDGTPSDVTPRTRLYGSSLKKAYQNNSTTNCDTTNSTISTSTSANNSTSLTILRYKTNINPYSPERELVNNNEIQIPTEKLSPWGVSRYVSEYETQYELGKGSYGVVTMSINRVDGWSYAIKKLTYHTEKMREKFLQESFAMSALQSHPHIVRYHSSWEEPLTNSIFIQCEWCKGGSLKKQKYEMAFVFSQVELCKIIRHICKALIYMHTLGFAHGDVKPENILVNTPQIVEETEYKLGDLGSINESGDGRYLAPELLLCEDDDKAMMNNQGKADVFSLGMSIFELTQENGYGGFEKGSQIKSEDIQLPSESFNSDFQHLLRTMLQQDPEQRPTVLRLQEDPLLLDEKVLVIQQNEYLREQVELLKRYIEELEGNRNRKKKAKAYFDMSTLLSPLGDDAETTTNDVPTTSPPMSPYTSYSSTTQTPERNNALSPTNSNPEFSIQITPPSSSSSKSNALFGSPRSPMPFEASLFAGSLTEELYSKNSPDNLTTPASPPTDPSSPATPLTSQIRRSLLGQMNTLETPENQRTESRLGFVTPQTPSFSPCNFPLPGPTNP